jgi:Spy/CpxP family protein refolding chaperone
MLQRKLVHALVAVSLAVAAADGFAQQPQKPAPGPGMGPGMMGGYGPGGPGYGMGPGMMGGYGPGYGGGYGPGYGMGPGMMGGYGPGAGYGMGMMGGMMGPGMMGPGMMGGGMMGTARALWALDLNDAQRKEILKVQDEVRKKNWEIAGKMQDEMAKLRDAYWGGEKRNRAAISTAYKRIGELRQQRIEIALDAADKVEKVLTAEQRESLKRWGPWWMMDFE